MFTTTGWIGFCVTLGIPCILLPIRFMAYKDPKRRQMWLKLWLKEIEVAEEEFPVLFNIDELEEFQERGYTNTRLE